MVEVVTTVKARIHVAMDGSLSGRAAGLPAGEHDAEISLLDASKGPIESDANVLLTRVRAIQDALARLPVLDDRSPEEIIGYNDRGHFG